MRTVDLITKKRDGFTLTASEVEHLIHGFTVGDIPDYQMSAFLMAVYWRGMDLTETISLTRSMVQSGEVLDLRAISPVIIDKHSTGGVGDKTTLVVAPLLAAFGLPIAKMSGRGLGFTGGTIDKLESFPGFHTSLSREEFFQNLKEHRIAITSQNATLAPADGKLYALRDVTGTVESIPLIASSVMSKKIAAGATVIALDVKAGSGAFMKTIPEAIELARVMVEIGKSFQRRTLAVISDMDQPLGKAIGNVLEVREAIDTLKGKGPEDLHELSMTLAVHALHAADGAETVSLARQELEQILFSGRALDKLAELVKAQGGDPKYVYEPELLGEAPVIRPIASPKSGYIARVNAMSLGLGAMILGAGRAKKGDEIDHLVGLIVEAKAGDFVRKGDTLAMVHARSEDEIAGITDQLLNAFAYSDSPVKKPDLIHEILAENWQR